ncbi:MAG: NACHT domain-containing protein [Alphaproteobacteria bacterium]|nr:NACHT domain-containing protein [Alphaproteobacteria bacterium]
MDTRLSPAEVSARLDELLLIHEGSRAVLGLLLCPERHLDGLLSSLRAQLAALPPESVELKVLRGEGDDARWLGWANHARNLWLRTHRLVLLVVTTPEGLREARRLANDLTVAPDLYGEVGPGESSLSWGEAADRVRRWTEERLGWVERPAKDGRLERRALLDVYVPMLRLKRLHAERRVVLLLGDAGSGKTTTLRWFALKYGSRTGDPLRIGDALPLFVDLSEYRNALTRRSMGLLDFLRLKLEQRLPGVAAPLLAQPERLLLLLDGLDQLPGMARRQEVLEELCRMEETGNLRAAVVSGRPWLLRDVEPMQLERFALVHVPHLARLARSDDALRPVFSIWMGREVSAYDRTELWRLVAEEELQSWRQAWSSRVADYDPDRAEEADVILQRLAFSGVKRWLEVWPRAELVKELCGLSAQLGGPPARAEQVEAVLGFMTIGPLRPAPPEGNTGGADAQQFSFHPAGLRDYLAALAAAAPGPEREEVLRDPVEPRWVGVLPFLVALLLERVETTDALALVRAVQAATLPGSQMGILGVFLLMDILEHAQLPRSMTKECAVRIFSFLLTDELPEPVLATQREILMGFVQLAAARPYADAVCDELERCLMTRPIEPSWGVEFYQGLLQAAEAYQLQATELRRALAQASSDALRALVAPRSEVG